MGDNPWNLTFREAEILSAIVQGGSSKIAALELGISDKTVCTLMHRAMERMGVRTRLHLLIQFDRWQRENKEA